jgi:gliding motility-associated-like protein
MRITFVIFLSIISLILTAQRGKNGDITITANSIINEYTSLSSSVNQGATTLTVANSGLNSNNRFGANLAAGDLLLIIQMQGVGINTTTTYEQYGEITAYNNCGKYEFCEVVSVPSATSITIKCGLKNDYTATGKVQVIRVPRYNSLTVDATINGQPWDGTLGGIICMEVLQNTVINASGSINANGIGFRGGIEDYATTNYGNWQVAVNNSDAGGVKGESVFGFNADYDLVGGRYSLGAIANGGGGGNNHNAGGGGGGNAGIVANWVNGVGVPNPVYNSAWALETPSISGIARSGGGRGGYTFSSNNVNPLTNGPNSISTWSGDGRRPVGGLGGRPLDYSANRLFLGGGGGSGDANQSNSVGGHGGNGGGLIFIKSYGNVSGAGSITANGNNGVDLTCPNPAFGTFGGNDGAGGAGAGGTVVIESLNGVNNLTISANGGNGGNQVFVAGSFYFGTFSEAEGPGGGGGGGYVAVTNPIGVNSTANGGNAGTTNSTTMTNFPVNGATNGGIGTITTISAPYNIIAENDTICSGTSTTLTASVIGTLPAGASILWFDAPYGNFIGAGNSFTTNNLFNDTTFYVSFCPGDFVVPVSVIMGVSFSIDQSNLVINNENCGQGDGSITGIEIIDGALPITYEWNGIVQASADQTNLTAGNYSLFVADGNGCGTTVGPFVVVENTGPAIDTQNSIISADHCNQSTGGISGISISGTGPFTYFLNGNAVSSTDVTNLPAGDYTFIVADVFGCSASSNVITIPEADPIAIDLSQISIVSAACNQATGAITGINIINGNAPFTYTLNGISVNSLDSFGLTSGEYTIVVEDAYGCTASSSSITVPEADPLLIDSSSVIVSPATCNLSNGSITGITVINGIAPYTYSWSNTAQITADIENLNAGNYVLTVTDSLGCSVVSNPIVIIQTGEPTSDFELIPTPIFIGDTLLINNLASSDVTGWNYTLDGEPLDSLPNSAVFIQNRGTYTICQVVTNNYGCQDSSCQVIIVNELPVEVTLPLPNIVTVNNDGSNDVFSIEGNLSNHSITIFNRWGQLIFEANPYLNDWDGKNNAGKDVPEGTYYFVLQSLEDEAKSYTGFVTLVR